MAVSPSRLYPDGIVIEAVHPKLQAVIDAAEGQTREQIDAAWRAAEHERRIKRGDAWPLGRLTELGGY